MPKPVDLTGHRYGKLLAIEPAGFSGRRPLWRCVCVCGKEKIASAQSLRAGKTISCGCAYAEAGARRAPQQRKHGMAESPEYATWCRIKDRCLNQNNPKYERYGARGIVVCERWVQSFDNFYSDMGKRPSDKHSIDRVNNDGPYSPDNCRWAAPQEQARNKSNNRWLTAAGVTETLTWWAARLGTSSGGLHGRLKRGEKIEDFVVRHTTFND